MATAEKHDPGPPEVGADEARTILRTMLRARQLEESLARSYAEGKLPGFIHSGEGQEAIGGAFSVCLEPTDYMVPHPRSRPEQLAKGLSVREIVAEVFATADSFSGGRGGEVHSMSVEHRMIGMSGVLGSSIALGNGVALASKLAGAREATVCSFGDGSSNRGTFHEALNLAGVWELPIVFFCINNGFSELSRIDELMLAENVADRAAGYGMPTRVVDGHDPEAVIAALAPALAEARDGRPSFLEAKVMRRRGHWEGDPQHYREGEDPESLAAVDPMPAYRRRAIAEHGLTEEEVAEWEREAVAEVEEAIEWAISRPTLAAAEVERYVYAEGEADG